MLCVFHSSSSFLLSNVVEGGALLWRLFDASRVLAPLCLQPRVPRAMIAFAAHW
jgi:hypothetical protein